MPKMIVYALLLKRQVAIWLLCAIKRMRTCIFGRSNQFKVLYMQSFAEHGLPLSIEKLPVGVRCYVISRLEKKAG